ncbi:MAG: guanylate kinase [Gemmatimonadota bacterium]
MRTHPFAVVIAAPSGAGKTSLARALVEADPQLEFSVSATTRPQRKGEYDRRDYYFVDEVEFDRMATTGELIEWAAVHGHKYGTPRRSLEEPLERQKNVVLDIDVQGARQVRAAYPDAVLIFILPPSVGELDRRLAGRGSEGSAERRTRLATAREELAAARDFDYIVVNDDFSTALATLKSILIAERHRRERYDQLPEQMAEMQHQLTNLLKGRE